MRSFSYYVKDVVTSIFKWKFFLLSSVINIESFFGYFSCKNNFFSLLKMCNLCLQTRIFTHRWFSVLNWVEVVIITWKTWMVTKKKLRTPNWKDFWNKMMVKRRNNDRADAMTQHPFWTVLKTWVWVKYKYWQPFCFSRNSLKSQEFCS